MKEPEVFRNSTIKRELSRISGALRNCSHAGLFVHSSPDGDAVGTALALSLVLEKGDTSCTLVYPDFFPDRFSFLNGSHRFVKGDEVRCGDFEVAVVLDSSNLGRLGDARRLVEDSELVINIDHHPDNSRFGDLNLVVPQAAAAGEIIYWLVGHMKLKMDKDVAEALYTAIASDTGFFAFENTTRHSHLLAARLIQAGAPSHEVYANLHENESLGSLRLLGKALAGLQVQSPVAWTAVTQQMMKETGTSPQHAGGISAFTRRVADITVGIAFTELAPRQIKVSWRTSYPMNAVVFAEAMNGGGHTRAAGCTVELELERAVDRVLETTMELLPKARQENGGHECG